MSPSVISPVRRRLAAAGTVAATLALGLVGVPAQALTSPGLTGTSPDATVATANARVSALAQAGNVLYVGGQFSSIGDQPRVGVAALDATTGQVLPSFVANVGGISAGGQDSGVTSLAVTADGTGLLVGGTFTSVNGVARTNLAKVSTSTGALSAWNPAPNNTVMALAVAGSKVLVAGKFGVISRLRIARLAEIDATTAAAYTSFAPAPNDVVRALHVNPGGASVLLGGDFTTVGGLSRPHLAAVSTTTGAPGSWRPLANGCPVYSIATDARRTRVVVGCGGGGTGGNRVDAFYYSTGGSAWPGLGGPTAPARTDGNVIAVAVVGDTVYAGGHFATVAGVDQKKTAALDAYTGGLQTWNPHFDPAAGASPLGVFALLAGAGHLWAGGDFVNPVPHLARFSAPAPPAAPAPVPAMVAAQGSDGAAYVYRPDTGSWTGFGGRIVGPPAVVSAAAPYGLYLVASTSSGLLWSRTASTGWAVAAPANTSCANPDLTYAGTALLLACTGSNKALYTARFDTSQPGNPYFAGFTGLGGLLTAGPAVHVNPASATPVYTGVGGSSDSTLADLYTRTDAAAWTAINTRCAGHPAVGTRAGSFLYTGCRDSLDGTMHVTISVPGQPGAVFDGSLGGALVGGVGVAVAPDDSAATFFVEGSTGQAYRITVASNGTASGWGPLGGAVVGGVRATPAP